MFLITPLALTMKEKKGHAVTIKQFKKVPESPVRLRTAGCFIVSPRVSLKIR